MEAIDALINAAGGFAVDKVESGDAAIWDRLFATNLTTTLNATQAALRYVLASDSGRIVNVGALGGLKADAGMGLRRRANRPCIELTGKSSSRRS